MFGQIFSPVDWIPSALIAIDLKEYYAVYFGIFPCPVLGGVSILCLARNTMWRVNRNQGTEKKIDCLSEELHYEKEAPKNGCKKQQIKFSSPAQKYQLVWSTCTKENTCTFLEFLHVSLFSKLYPFSVHQVPWQLPMKGVLRHEQSIWMAASKKIWLFFFIINN